MDERSTSEMELLQSWYEEMVKPSHQYKEPILDEDALKILKKICDAFDQDMHVFFRALEIYEEYMRRKCRNDDYLDEEVLILVTSIFISSKFTGGSNGLRIEYIIEFLQDFTNVDYDSKTITDTEIEILRTLNGSLPLTTIVDDMNTVIELYIKDTHIKANVRPLCLEILQLMYLRRNTWFTKLKSLYSQNDASFLVFKSLMVYRLYIPVVILTISLNMTHYRGISDIHFIITNMSRVTMIHGYHLNVLASSILNILPSYS